MLRLHDEFLYLIVLFSAVACGGLTSLGTDQEQSAGDDGGGGHSASGSGTVGGIGSGIGGSGALTVAMGSSSSVGTSGTVTIATGGSSTVTGIVGTTVWATGGYVSIGGTTSATGGTTVDLPAVELPDTCVASYAYSYSEGCELDLTCGSSWISSYCYQTDASHVACSCSATSKSASYVVTGAKAATACEYIANLCIGGDAPAFTEEPVCTQTYQSEYSTYCEGSQQCTQSADIAEGVSIVETTYVSSYCSAWDGLWNCSCYGSAVGNSTSFTIASDVSYTVACPLSYDLCTGEAAIESETAMVCTQSSQSAYTTECSAALDCQQTGVVSDMDIDLHETLSLSCLQNTEGGWDCQCILGTQSTNYAITETDVTAWNACTQASTECESLLVPAS